MVISDDLFIITLHNYVINQSKYNCMIDVSVVCHHSYGDTRNMVGETLHL